MIIDEKCFADYLDWVESEAGVIAPKVTLRCIENDLKVGDETLDQGYGCESRRQRGLFATETIFPGERIMFVPSQSLICIDFLQRSGSHLIDQKCGNENSTIDEEETDFLQDMEAGIIHYIEKLRCYVKEKNKISLSGVFDFEWREDDGIALYLASARTLLQLYRNKNGFKKYQLSIEEQREALRQHTLPNSDTILSLQEPSEVEVVNAYAAEDIPLTTAKFFDTPNDNALSKEFIESDDSKVAVNSNCEVRGDCYLEQEAALVEEFEVAMVSATDTTANPLGAGGEETCRSDNCDTHVYSATRIYPSFLPHVQQLPESFPSSPLYYRLDELNRLDGTNCYEYALRMRQQIESDWARLAAVLQHFQRTEGNRIVLNVKSKPSEVEATMSSTSTFTSNRHESFVGLDELTFDQLVSYESYKWAIVNIYSRSSDFFVPQNSSSGSGSADDQVQLQHLRVIAPFFDMMNHSFNSTVTHSLDPVTGDLSVFNGSNQMIEAGEEITMTYGNFSNEKLLLIYGFVIPNNPYDCVSIYAPIPMSDPYYDVKARVLQSFCGIDDLNAPHVLQLQSQQQRNSFIHADTEPPTTSTLSTFDSTASIIPKSLLSVLRIVGIQSLDGIISLCDNIQENGSLVMISVENERSALTALQHALYGMTRQLALNMISDENLQAATSKPIAMSEQQFFNDADSAMKNVNISNAKLLCQSEYTILQVALTELSERLAILDGSILLVQ